MSSFNYGFAAPPSAGTGPNLFLIAHARIGIVNYITVTVNGSNSNVLIGDPTPDLQTDLPGIGNWSLWTKFLFHVDVLDSYFGVSFVNEVLGSTQALHIYFWKDIDQYSALRQPFYTYERVVPYCDNEFGVIGGAPAIDQENGIVYLNVAFWQPCDENYDSGWLLAYNAHDNSVGPVVKYPNHVAPYLDWWIETVWSAKRKQMYSAIFYSWYSIIVDIVDVKTGANKTIISGDQWGTSMDGYNSKQLFDDFSGNWFILTDNELTTVDAGLPFNLYVINVDHATIAPVNQFVVPSDVLAMSLNGHIAATKAMKEAEKAKQNAAVAAKKRQVALRNQATTARQAPKSASE